MSFRHIGGGHLLHATRHLIPPIPGLASVIREGARSSVMTSPTEKICDEAEEWARVYAESLAKLRAQRALELLQSGGACRKTAPQGSSREKSSSSSSSTKSTLAQASSANSLPGSERRPSVGFGPRRSRPKASHRRPWASSHQQRFKSTGANLADYSHTTPIGGWSIPLMGSDGSQPSTCQALSEGRAPAVAYTRNYEEAEELLECLPLGHALGFDMEWNFEPDTRRSYKTALVQICSPSLILIIQLSALKRLPPRLRALLEDRDTIKTGVAIRADCSKLQRDYGVQANGVLELSTFARRVQVDYWKPQKRVGLISLQELCRIYLERHLIKDATRTSNWERELNAKQVEYAASDTYVGLEILGKLCGLANDAAAKEDGEKKAEAVVDQASKTTKVKQSSSAPSAAAIDHVDEAAVAAFGGGRASTTKTRGETIVIEDSSEDESSTKAERQPLRSVETSARINTETATEKKTSGWLTRGKGSQSSPSASTEPRSVTVMKALLRHFGGKDKGGLSKA